MSGLESKRMFPGPGTSLLIGSGAVGTCLRRAGVPADEPVEILNLRRPADVGAVHAMYRAAGSRVLVTNTFAAHPLAFSDAGLEDEWPAANRAGVALARAAAGTDCAVWASVGPLGLGLRADDYTDAALDDLYRRWCDALAGADALLLETFVDPREARAALRAAGATDRPVVFQIGNTGSGPGRWERIDALLAEAVRAGVVAVGANCMHPSDIVRVVTYLGERTDLPLSAAPNAGHPRIDRGVVAYEFGPDAFAEVAAALCAAGVAVLGGCCGTTPEHIRRVAAVWAGRAVIPRDRAGMRPRRVAPVIERPAPGDNPVRTLLASQRFLIAVEIRADRTRSLDEISAGAARVAAAGADMFDVPDNPGATVGRDAMVTAARLQHDHRIPALGHLAVTQSNLLRLHSTLIGCWDLGLRGVLAVTGDAPAMGHLGNLAHRVTDLRGSVELLRLIGMLRRGGLANGDHLADAPDLCAGCAVGKPVPAQIRWLNMKIEAGAEFVFAQPLFAMDDYARLRDALAGLPIRFFPGIMPLVSHRGAAALAAGRIPGIAVPTAVVAGFERLASAEDQRRHGLEQAAALAAAIAADATGLYIVMPFGRRCYEDTARLVAGLR